MLTKVRAALAGTCALIGVAALAGSAAADTATFEHTGAAQEWTVPYGVSSATFDLYGAQGGVHRKHAADVQHDDEPAAHRLGALQARPA